MDLTYDVASFPLPAQPGNATAETHPCPENEKENSWEAAQIEMEEHQDPSLRLLN